MVLDNVSGARLRSANKRTEDAKKRREKLEPLLTALAAAIEASGTKVYTIAAAQPGLKPGTVKRIKNWESHKKSTVSDVFLLATVHALRALLKAAIKREEAGDDSTTFKAAMKDLEEQKELRRLEGRAMPMLSTTPTEDASRLEAEVTRLEKELAAAQAELAESKTVAKNSAKDVEVLKNQFKTLETEVINIRNNYNIYGELQKSLHGYSKGLLTYACIYRHPDAANGMFRMFLFHISTKPDMWPDFECLHPWQFKGIVLAKRPNHLFCFGAHEKNEILFMQLECKRPKFGLVAGMLMAPYLDGGEEDGYTAQRVIAVRVAHDAKDRIRRVLNLDQDDQVSPLVIENTWDACAGYLVDQLEGRTMDNKRLTKEDLPRLRTLLGNARPIGSCQLRYYHYR